MIEEFKVKYAELIAKYRGALAEHKIALSNYAKLHSCHFENTPAIQECSAILHRAEREEMALCDHLGTKILTFAHADFDGDYDLVDQVWNSINAEGSNQQ